MGCLASASSISCRSKFFRTSIIWEPISLVIHIYQYQHTVSHMNKRAERVWASVLCRLTSPPLISMDANSAKAKLDAAKHKLGRDVRVFETSIVSQTQIDAANNDDEEDDMYEFTPADYYRVLGPKKQDNVLKTRKIREAEEAARRSRITKAVIRVRFPDNHTLEVTFHPSETIQLLNDFLKKALARPELPFYLYTTPPKKQIKDMSQDFYSAGFAPGAIVYFSQDLPKDDNGVHESSSFLQEEIISLKGLELIAEQVEPVQPAPESSEPAVEIPSVAVKEQKAADKKAIKPKWLRM